MCGISACLVSKELTIEVINKTLFNMINRGPDNQSYKKFIFGNKLLYLFHSRLSIIDLREVSNQPFSYKGYHLIFNGEIYNYKELKKKYLNEFTFKTNSDTEVLLYMYIKYGKNFEEKLNGMWSFIIFDENKKKLHVSRDRFGEKPLHYFINNNNDFFFSSEIKNIQTLTGTKLDLNLKTIQRFLVFGYKSLYKYDDHYYKSLKRLKASTFLEINSDLNYSLENYYTPSVKINSLSVEENIENTKYLLIESVKSRMISDVPIAFSLSGGVDSTAITNIATKILNKNISTYSILDDDIRYDESSNINKSLRTLESKHQFIDLKTKFNLESLSQLINYHDEPLCSINFFSDSLLKKEMRSDGHKVSISGIGADEYFAGYWDHHSYLMHELKSSDKNKYEIFKNDWLNHIMPLIQNPILKKTDLFEIKGLDFNSFRYQDNDVYSKLLIGGFEENQNDFKFNTTSILKNRMLNELFFETLPIALDNEDLNSMYHSVENRSPFLNHDLVDYVNTIPSNQLINNGYSKYILREAINGIADDEVRLDRNKRGFNASTESFLSNSQQDTLDLMNSDSILYDIVDKENIINFMNGENSFENWDKKFLFNLINVKIFLDLH